MITRIREVRRARGLTLQQVADRCSPPTTAQTIGRLENGARTVSVGWLNRIADALEVASDTLVRMPDQIEIPLAATLGHDGVGAAGDARVIMAPRTESGMLAVAVTSATGEYRGGDEIWMRRVEPGRFSAAINRDILVPRPGGRFVFGRLIDWDGEKLHLLPAGAGQRQTVVAAPLWLAVAVRLIRPL